MPFQYISFDFHSNVLREEETLLLVLTQLSETDEPAALRRVPTDGHFT